MINQQRMIDNFTEMVSINSPSKEERDLVNYVKEQIKGMNLECIEDEAGNRFGSNAGNVICHLKGNQPMAPKLLFAAHLDTVEATRGINPLNQEGLIKSDGRSILGADDKAGAAAILEAMRCLKEKDLPHGEITFIFTVGEEIGLYGAKYLDYSQISADFGYILDSGGRVGNVITEAPAEEDIKIEIFGRSAHAGVEPEAGINAIQAAGKLLAALPMGKLDQQTTANIGVIRGGQATNVIADYVEMLGEIRSRDESTLQRHLDFWKQTVNEVVSDMGAKANFENQRAYDSFKIQEGSPIVGLLAKAMASQGLDMVLTPRGGGSDTNIFNGQGIPSVNLAIGMEKNHTKEEFIPVAELVKAGELVLAIIAEAVKQENGY